jgi:GMP synthase (glutamine-hydrolysing)
MVREKIVIIDFGSQFTQLIARKVRELGVYSEIINFKKIKNLTKNKFIKGIILSGGPLTVTSKKTAKLDTAILNLKIPVLGICYGHQILSKNLGGKVKSSKKREFGRAVLKSISKSTITKNFFKKKTNLVWMSHQDIVSKIPEGFKKIASSTNSKFAIISNEKKKYYGIQFHPEVSHTKNGKILIKNFLFDICEMKRSWNSRKQKEILISKIKKQAGNNKVICALSGGVDSSVVALLLQKAIKKNLTCIFVNTGLLRKNEEKEVIKTFKKKFKIKLVYINASKLFLNELQGVTSPEKKRKIIGKLFIKLFEKYAKKSKQTKFLAQGTLYPDLIESKTVTGSPSSKIKSHHNVGGLPKKMKLALIEPLKELFKDEVRKLGVQLSLPKTILLRHPFPGPGLAIRIPGEVTREKVEILKNADFIYINELRKSNYYNKIWQAYAALLPVKTVGVMGDSRTYEYTCLLRAVTSEDGMTADFFNFDRIFLQKISNKIVNSVKGISRVVYDITSKPPSTIELE